MGRRARLAARSWPKQPRANTQLEGPMRIPKAGASGSVVGDARARICLTAKTWLRVVDGQEDGNPERETQTAQGGISCFSPKNVPLAGVHIYGPRYWL